MEASTFITSHSNPTSDGDRKRSVNGISTCTFSQPVRHRLLSSSSQSKAQVIQWHHFSLVNTTKVCYPTAAPMTMSTTVPFSVLQCPFQICPEEGRFMLKKSFTAHKDCTQAKLTDMQDLITKMSDVLKTILSIAFTITWVPYSVNEFKRGTRESENKSFVTLAENASWSKLLTWKRWAKKIIWLI